jgi:hypothetical protein
MNYKFQNEIFDFEDFSNEIVIINTNTGSYYTISGSSVTVLRWFFLPITIDKVNYLIQETFPNEVSDASTFVDWLKLQDLIQAVDNSEVTEDEQNITSESPIVFNDWTYSRFDDMSDLIRLDPIHDVSDKGWPHQKSNDK